MYKVSVHLDVVQKFTADQSAKCTHVSIKVFTITPTKKSQNESS